MESTIRPTCYHTPLEFITKSRDFCTQKPRNLLDTGKVPESGDDRQEVVSGKERAHVLMWETCCDLSIDVSGTRIGI